MRLVLNSLVAHVVADVPLQPEWMAERKFDSIAVRSLHVAINTAVFVPIVIASDWTRRQAATFLGAIAASHFTIDSRRWSQTAPLVVDQALHLLSMAVAFVLTGRSDRRPAERG